MSEKNVKTLINVAFCFGTSKYDSQPDLDAVENDLEVMYNILKKSNEFSKDHTYKWINNTSDNLLKLFQEKIKELKNDANTAINTLFLYYSGHGTLLNGDFRFLGKNYDSNTPNSTSISNNSIDDLIKSVNPKLTIKIIDACHSGIQYIKSDLEKEIKGSFSTSWGIFNSVYFMFSSLHNQSSKIKKDFSVFSKEIFKSLMNYKEKKIGYENIINFVRDAFLSNPEQTPFFVTQGDHTEIFCKVSTELSDYLETTINQNATHSLQVSSTAVIASKEDEIRDLLTILKQKETIFIEKDDLIEILNKIKSICNEYNYSSFNDYYNIDVNFLELYDEISNKRDIINFIDSSGKSYFCHVNTMEEKNPNYRRGLLGGAFNFGEPEYLIQKTGFELDVYDLPYIQIKFYFSPKFKSLNPYVLNIIFLFNNEDIRFFSQYIIEIRKNWTDYKNKYVSKWESKQFALREKQDIIDFFNERHFCKYN